MRIINLKTGSLNKVLLKRVKIVSRAIADATIGIIETETVMVAIARIVTVNLAIWKVKIQKAEKTKLLVETTVNVMMANAMMVKALVILIKTKIVSIVIMIGKDVKRMEEIVKDKILRMAVLLNKVRRVEMGRIKRIVNVVQTIDVGIITIDRTIDATTNVVVRTIVEMVVATKEMVVAMNKIICFLLLTLAFVSCSGDEVVFQKSVEFPNEGWNKDSVAVFDFEATDTVGSYDIVVDLRNDGSYRYQNFWLFVRSVSPDSVVFSDTLECVLADNYGRWIGEGSGSMRHLPVMFLSDVKFPKKGVYSFELIQGMREDLLQGIHDIGLRIMKSNPEENK